MKLCEYKNIFGEPNTGIHSYRIFNIAIVDTLATIVVAIIITLVIKLLWKKKFKSQKNKYLIIWIFVIILISLFLLGIFAHWLFCVNTTINKYLFS